MTVTAGPEQTLRGYSLPDLLGLARAAVATGRPYRRIAMFGDYITAAYDSIIDSLCNGEADPPTPDELFRAAADGLHRFQREMYRHHGYDRDHGGLRPAYVKYWTTWHPPLPEDAVIEPLAVAQIWVKLTPLQRDALTALVAADFSPRRAAHMVGVPYKTFTGRVDLARRRFLEFWHEGETPSVYWRSSTEVVQTPARRYAACIRWHTPGCECWQDEPTEADKWCSVGDCTRSFRKRWRGTRMCQTHYSQAWRATQVPVGD